MDEDVEQYLERIKLEHEERVFFLQQGLGAEVHWFFSQGFDALTSGLFLPACASFIIGIEASLRVTMHQINIPARVEELDPAKTLSNRLINKAQENGLPVKLLAFPKEHDFDEKLASIKPNQKNIEIVRIRHNLCHGNILEYINTELGEDNVFFTPDCCRGLAICLYFISKNWAKGLGEFRAKRFEV
ncbi:hypothetical protein [Rheinheimera salexigens]|uniref:Uncharacterized protein n=1 Tax=Rheinheimera salexigens TaxID=1628148 RepID=A0A1E7Q686_9GAMM|nr:hypothetical protein [Rheinheimera salexigens]OEY69583.1 hypothetical protein BI198_08435 [Rheinheimera salexigens]